MCYDRISLGRLRFWIHMQDAVLSLQQLGEAAAPAVLGLGPCRPRPRRHCNPGLGVPSCNPRGHPVSSFPISAEPSLFPESLVFSGHHIQNATVWGRGPLPAHNPQECL